MDKHVIYIWIDDREFIEIYDSSFNFGFDDYYNISNLEIYFNDSSYKGNINKIQNGSNISVESNEFCSIETSAWIVEKSSITNVSIEYDRDTLEVKLLIHFHSKMIRGDEMIKIKKKMKRSKNLKNILNK